MKILHVINNLGSGGAEKLIEDMLPIMNEDRNIQADLLLLTDEGNVFGKDLEEKDVKINVIDLRNPRNPLNILKIRKYILDGDYDIVHSHLFPTQYWVVFARMLIGKKDIKLVTTEHSTHNRRREKGYLNLLERYIYSRYRKVISISDGTQKNLMAWIGEKNEEKFTIINNGINIEKFINAKAYHKVEINDNFTEDTKLLCMIGRFSEQKDQATIIRALTYLDDDIHLLLIGEGPLLEENKKLAKDMGVDDRVHFLGFRNDIERIFKTCDIVIISSNWEGFGLVAVEGMASGKPVVASDVDGLKEVVEGAGVLFKKGCAEDLSERIKLLISNPQEYDNRKRLSTKKATIYDMDKMVGEYLDLYINITQS